MREDESHVVLFITTVLSHLTMLPMPFFFYRRGYVMEFCGSLFALLASFMYHSAESCGTPLLLTEKEWHRLDNIGIVSIIGMWDVYLCCFTNTFVDTCCKCFCVFFTLIIQQKHPWDVRFTATPIILFSVFPIVKYCFLERRLPPVNVRYLLFGIFFASFAVPFFILGLNDSEDPYRMYHGGWHFFMGIGSFFLWLMVKHPSSHGGAMRSQSSIVLKGDAIL
jgi:predicted membrane channel-forming protein YqfA (hemolysin III family)